MLPFGEFLNDLLAECWQIVWLATGDESIVRVNFNVDPRAAGVANVRLQARPRGQRSTANHIGLDEHPWTMTDCPDRFPGVEEGMHECDGILVRAQMIRVLVTTQMDCGESVPLVSFRSVQVALGAERKEHGSYRENRSADVLHNRRHGSGVWRIAGAIGAAAYRGEFTTWQSMKSDFSAFLLVSAFDTGDVYSNTEVVNLVDAAFVRDSLGSQYKNVRSMGNIAPVPGTTVVRMFTFTLKGDNGTLVVTDEYGSNVWFFMFSTTKVSGSEMESFVSGTVLAQIPTNLPTGYDEAKLKQ